MTRYETTELHNAVKLGDSKGIAELISTRKCNIEDLNERKQNVFHISALYKQSETLKWIFEYLSENNQINIDIDAKDIEGRTPLHIACTSPCTEIVKSLLVKGASPFLKNEAGLSPIVMLFLASDKFIESDLYVLQEVISIFSSKGVSITEVDTDGNTPVHLLLQKSNRDIQLSILSSLLLINNESLSISNNRGDTPLSLCIKYNLRDAIKVILSYQPPVDLCRSLLETVKDENLKAPLQSYIFENSNKIMQFKIQREGPGLISRCKLLDLNYPSKQIELKVIINWEPNYTVTIKCTPFLRVIDAITKLINNNSNLSKLSPFDLSFFLPSRADNSNSNSNCSLSGSSGGRDILLNNSIQKQNSNSSLTKAGITPVPSVYLQPELYLWEYDLQSETTIEMGKKDPKTELYVWVKVIHKTAAGLQTKILRIQRGRIVRELINEVNNLFTVSSNQFTSLYLYNNHIHGHWIEEEEKPIEYYGLRDMDIIELKEKPTYKIAVKNGSLNDDIQFDKLTTISNFLIMLICWSPTPIDEPSLAGVYIIKKDMKLLDPPLLLERSKTIGDYELLKDDELQFFFDFRSPSSLIETFVVKSDPDSLNAPTVDGSKQVLNLKLKLGETIIENYDVSLVSGVSLQLKDYILYITKFSLFFGQMDRKGYVHAHSSVNLGLIFKLEKIDLNDAIGLEVFCKDVRSFRVFFSPVDNVVVAKQQRDRAYQSIFDLAFPKSFHNFITFNDAIVNSLSESDYGWNLYSLENEFKRMEIPSSQWRISDININYDYCGTYPSRLIVPYIVSEDALKNVFPYRSKGRIPILTYYHHNSAVIARSSQPKVGVTNNRNYDDESLLSAIRQVNMKNSSTLYIFDARPKTNAMANQAFGMGYEKVNASSYKNCKFEFLNIDNIHVMRDSYQKLQKLCENSFNNDKNFYSQLENTQWLSHIRLLIRNSAKIANIIDEEGCSVLIHCSDGWDRTAQLSSLAQILLNPFYRTFEGFQILIEKDWITTGHQFALRYGIGSSNSGDDQRSPIFLQFIDCVWQLLHQFPCEFEFTEKYLIDILDSVFSCNHGTFLCNTDRERLHLHLAEITSSSWTELLHHKDLYLNPFFFPGNISPLYPSPFPEHYQLWCSYFLRWCRPPSFGLTVEIRGIQMKCMNDSLSQQIAALQDEIKKLKSSVAYYQYQ